MPTPEGLAGQSGQTDFTLRVKSVYGVCGTSPLTAPLDSFQLTSEATQPL